MSILDPFYSGLNVMGYYALPPASRDAQGNVVIPGLSFPEEEWNAAVGQVLAHPAWTELFKAIGELTIVGSKWECWKVCVSFVTGRVQLLVSRSRAGLDPEVARTWANSFHNAFVVENLQAYAGQRYVFPQQLVAPLKAAAAWASASASSRPDKPPPPIPSGASADATAIAEAQAAQAKYNADTRAWYVKIFLDLAAHVVEFVGNLHERGEVQATVVWFDNHNVAATEWDWPPLATLYSSRNARTLNVLWNPACQDPSGIAGKYIAPPIVYAANQTWTGWFVTPVAQDPLELTSVMYPDYSPPQPPPAPFVPSPRDSDDWFPRHIGPEGREILFGTDGPVVEAIMAPIGNLDRGFALQTAQANSAPSKPVITAFAAAVARKGDMDLVGVGDVTNGRFRFSDRSSGPPMIWLSPLRRIAVARADGTYEVGAETASPWEPSRLPKRRGGAARA